MDIKTLITEAHQTAIDHGWWENWGKIIYALPGDMSETFENYVSNSCLMLMASELGEACEAIRHGDDENLAEELADVVIRIADYCGWKCIDLEKAITEKMAKNKTRPYMHGNKRL